MKSYDYKNRDGVVEMDWAWFAALAQQLAGEMAAEGGETIRLPRGRTSDP